jgi:arylsulfatase A-like enzyme
LVNLKTLPGIQLKKIDLNSYLFWIIFFIATSSFVASAQIQSSDKNRPNVLFIMVDDLRPELGCYGHAYAKTPNIDRLAARSAVFNKHYVVVPTCGASRAALLTGRLPRKPEDLTNEVMEHRSGIGSGDRSADPESFVEQFRRNGYYTVGIGKISHSTDGYVYKYLDPVSERRELPNSWDDLFFNPGKWKTGWNAFFGYADGTNRNALKGEVKPYEAADVTDEGYPDGLTAARAVEKIGELASRGKPFFLGVGFFKPHLPFNAPKRYWDLYDPREIPPVPYPGLPEGVHPASLQASGEFNAYRRGEAKASLSGTLSEDYARKLRHGYMASVSYVDAQIGKLLDALRASGLERNTIVILWGDHGWHLGDHRVWGKHTLSEWSLRSPLIMAVPGIRKGSVSDHVVSSIDIYPTLMSLCHLPAPDSLEGKVILPRSGFFSISRHHRQAFGFFNRGVTMRNSRYRLTRYYRVEKPDIELYDHLTDPYEHVNIAARRPGLTRRLIRRLPPSAALYNVR